MMTSQISVSLPSGTRTATLVKKTNMEFPKPVKVSFDVEGYLKKYNKGYWRLPFMQRNQDTWPDDHYRELIESIYNNILTSPFVGSKRGSLDHVLLDGGHRTEALVRFTNDKFKITCPDTNEEKLWSELTEKSKAEFYQHTLDFIIYDNLTPLQEETLYFKLNNSLPLTPGEVVNGFETVPICKLARELGDHYADKLKRFFRRGIEGQNLRADSSNLMFMLLRNFHQRKIVKGEKLKKKEELKEVCETLRDSEIDEDTLRSNVTCLFRIIESKKMDNPYLLMILPTVQAIMLKHQIGLSKLEPGEIDERTAKYAHLISKFLFEIEKSTNPLNKNWQSLKRKPDDETIKGVQNPGSPTNCAKRVEIFTEWLASHQ